MLFTVAMFLIRLAVLKRIILLIILSKEIGNKWKLGIFDDRKMQARA